MNRSVREKVILGSLMAVGLLATISGIMKCVESKKNYRREDFFYYLPLLASWGHVTV
jgi:hypothetical protein